MDMHAPPAADALSSQEDLSLKEDLNLLVADAKAFAHAELTYQKTRAAYASSKTKIIALLLVVAAVLIFFAVMATVVGTVIALGPVLGLWGAMAAVVITLLVITAACGFAALHHAKQMKTVLSEEATVGSHS